jgi:hypothetical protein
VSFQLWILTARPRLGAVTFGLCLLAVVGAFGVSAQVAPDQGTVLAAEPLWGGWFVPGRTTEIRVRLTSTTGGEAKVNIRSGSFTLNATAILAAATPHSLILPLRPGHDGRVVVAAELPDGSVHRIVVSLHATSDRGGLRVSSGLPERGLDLMMTPPENLPRTPDGYGPVGSLVLGTPALKVMDHAQITALAHYLTGCRPLDFVDVSEPTLRHLRAVGGCGRRGADTLGEDPGEAPASLAHLSPPGFAPTDDGRWAAILLLPYGLLLMGLVLAGRPGHWVLVLPAAASALLLLVLPRVFTPAATLTWIDWEAGAGSARFTILITTRGYGGRARPLLLPPATRVPAALDGGPIELRFSSLDGAELAGPVSLFQQRRFLLTGLAAPPLDLDFTVAKSGYRISNRTGVALPNVWLVEPGCAWQVGTLPGGETSWSPPSAAAKAQDGPDPHAPGCQGLPPLAPLTGQTPALLVALAPGQWPATLADAPGPAWLRVHPAAVGLP